MNNVDLIPSLWLYAIHSNNAELIHLLEDYHVEPTDKSFEECFVESIKCHHNEFANYIFDNLLDKTKCIQNEFTEHSLDCCFKENNYSCFPSNFSYSNIIFNLIQYNYVNLFNLLLKAKQLDVNAT